LTLPFTRTRDLSQFSIHGAVGGASARATTRPSAPPPEQWRILSVAEHYWSPEKHPGEHSKPAKPDGGQKYFMCKNRWCSEKPGKTTPKLSTLPFGDQAEIDICCSDYDFKQTKRGYSTVATVIQKLSAIPFLGFGKKVHFPTLSSIAADFGSLPPFVAVQDVFWLDFDARIEY